MKTEENNISLELTLNPGPYHQDEFGAKMTNERYIA